MTAKVRTKFIYEQLIHCNFYNLICALKDDMVGNGFVSVFWTISLYKLFLNGFKCLKLNL